ncbi:MAG: hypothetical protein LBF08_07025 [Dysgonamonadaceae bacterium]|jgi:hypothetical protein|nr:hypothetical protein [Dysgonamonadaceae bacterium]
MRQRTQSQEIISTGIMVKGIKAHQDVLADRKIDLEFANDLQSDVDACISLNQDQETLKAKLKEKTAELDARLDTMQKKAAKARKIIKIDIPQPSWREFGIEDKR